MMKIDRVDLPVMTIEEFADANDLTMQIRERRVPANDPMRYYAHFASCEIIGDGVLLSTFGDGQTAEDAIADYAKAIELSRLAIDADTDKRRELVVPRLVANKTLPPIPPCR